MATISPGRLAQLKKGWPVETCPKCLGENPECGLCDGKPFRQRIDAGWQPPELGPGDVMTAYLDVDEWCYVGVLHPDGELTETAFPFEATGFATTKHMENLGFKVEF